METKYDLSNTKTDVTKSYLLYISVLQPKSLSCPFCKTKTADIFLHVVLDCTYLSTERNAFYYKMFNLISSERLSSFFNHNSNEIYTAMLSANNICVTNMSNTEWIEFITYSAQFVSSIFDSILLIERQTRYVFY